MRLALPCTSCGNRLPGFQKLFYQMSCDGIIQDVASIYFNDTSGHCDRWRSVQTAEEWIERKKIKKEKAIAKMKGPLVYNPFGVLKAKVKITKR